MVWSQTKLAFGMKKTLKYKSTKIEKHQNDNNTTKSYEDGLGWGGLTRRVRTTNLKKQVSSR